jgi:hypothetical protein
MWNIRRRLAPDRLPAKRRVVRFDFGGLPSQQRCNRVFWLIVERPDVDLCVQDPGADVDLYVQADLKAFANVWLGDLALPTALRSGLIKLTGQRQLMREFPSWLLLSHFAGVPRPTG